MQASSSHARQKEPEELNLIPLMNLFVTMIPLLLLTAAFYHIGMVSVSVPTQSEEESDVDTGHDAVTVNVRMGDKGINLTASNPSLPENELKALDGFVPKTSAGKHDLVRLQQALEKIKERYPGSKTMMLIPSKKTSYEQMIAAMDAARTMELQQQTKRARVPMFPLVVVTSLVQ